MSNWTEKDTAKETGDSTSKVAEAWHQANDDAAKAGELPERNASKTADRVNDSEDGPALRNFFWPHTKGK